MLLQQINDYADEEHNRFPLFLEEKRIVSPSTDAESHKIELGLILVVIYCFSAFLLKGRELILELRW